MPRGETVLSTPALREAFRHSWFLGAPLAELAALYGFSSDKAASRAARRLDLPRRPGGPRRPGQAPAEPPRVGLGPGEWVAGPGGTRRWRAAA